MYILVQSDESRSCLLPALISWKFRIVLHSVEEKENIESKVAQYKLESLMLAEENTHYILVE